MPLHKVQSDFINSLMTPEFNESSLIEALKPGQRLSPLQQLDVYRRNINGAYQKVLAQVYPACCRILGEDYFNQLCRLYRFEHPSINPDLNGYGEQFPAYLAEHVGQHEELSDFEYLADLAALEWCWHASYFCEDDEVFDFAGLQSLDEARQADVILELGHSICLQQTPYPVISIWQANRVEATSDQLFEHDGSLIYYLIFRQQFEPQIEPLPVEDYNYLQAIHAGQTMSNLIGQYGEALSARLAEFIQRGWITAYHVDTP